MSTLRVDEKAVQQFQREYLVDLRGVVAVAFKVATHHRFQRLGIKISPGEGSRVQKHFLHVFGKRIAVPDAEMVVLVPAEEKALEMERRQKMIDLGGPLGHPVVVGVFSFKRESVVTAKNGAGKLLAAASESHVCPYLPQCQIAVTDQPNAEVVILGHRLRCAEGDSNHIVIQEGPPHGELG